MLALIVSGLVLIVALNRWLNSGFGRDFIVSMIASQTGATVELESINSSLPRSLTVNNLALKLPLENISKHEESASIRFKQARFRISTFSLFYGTLRVKEAVVEGLEVQAERRDGVLWISGLQKYMKMRSPPPPAEDELKSDTQQEPLRMQDIEGIIGKVLVPFRIKIEEVGLRGMRLNFKDYVKGRQVHEVSLGPVDALFGMTAWLHSSHVWIRVAGEGEKGRLKFIYNGFGKGAAKFNKTFDFGLNLTLDNWNQLKMRRSPKNLPEDLDFQTEILALDGYKTIQIKQLDLKVGKILVNHLKTSVQFKDGRFDQLEIDLIESAKIRLSELNPYLTPFGVQVSGGLDLKSLTVNGFLDTGSLAQLERRNYQQ